VLTISVTLRNTPHTRRIDDRQMRYLAATVGLIGTLVLMAPFH
jgi:hypothetical protein